MSKVRHRKISECAIIYMHNIQVCVFNIHPYHLFTPKKQIHRMNSTYLLDYSVRAHQA